MVVRVVEDQAIPNLDEAATESVQKMIFGEDMIRWADGDGVTVDQKHLVADAGVVEIVGGDDDRVAAGDLVLDDIEDEAARGDIEAGDRLVEQQQIALLSQALSDEDSLALSAGEVVELFAGEIGDAESLHRPSDGVAVTAVEASEQSELGVAAESDRVAHRDGEIPINGGRLQDERWVIALPGNRAGEQIFDPGDGVQKG